MLWSGYALSALVTLFLLMDATMKLLQLPIVAETGLALGWPSETAFFLGVILMLCTLLYVWPRTAILGAILLTGYLGGAIASHIRIGNPLFSHVLFGVYLALFVWGGLWLRDTRLRALLPYASGLRK
ncbi:MAG: DoxX family protein [Prosthecobacter sp.]|nr:DoxX family protein [Prosthecobacter sp.]